MKLKKFLSGCAVLLCVGVSYKIVKAAPGASVTNATNINNLMLDENKIYDSNGVLRITVGAPNVLNGNAASEGSNSVGSGKVFYGTSTVAVSSTIVTGSSIGNIFTAVLAGGVPAVEGSALVAVSSGAIGGTNITVAVAPASALTTSFVGVANAAASTGSLVNVVSYGWANAMTVGTVNPGDQVYISSVPGNMASIAFTTVPVCGIALQQQSNLFGGLTRIRLK